MGEGSDEAGRKGEAQDASSSRSQGEEGGGQTEATFSSGPAAQVSELKGLPQDGSVLLGTTHRHFPKGGSSSFGMAAILKCSVTVEESFLGSLMGLLSQRSGFVRAF